jgi:hypothetical protein
MRVAVNARGVHVGKVQLLVRAEPRPDLLDGLPEHDAA